MSPSVRVYYVVKGRPPARLLLHLLLTVESLSDWPCYLLEVPAIQAVTRGLSIAKWLLDAGNSRLYLHGRYKGACVNKRKPCS